jgi:hypothetical protein
MDCHCEQESHLSVEGPLVVLVPFSMALIIITIIWEVRHHRELSFFCAFRLCLTRFFVGTNTH